MWKVAETPCQGPDRAAVEARQAFARARLAEAAARYPNVELLPVLERFCDAARCGTIHEGKVLYYDDDHLSRPGARLAAAPLRFRDAGAESAVR